MAASLAFNHVAAVTVAHTALSSPCTGLFPTTMAHISVPPINAMAHLDLSLYPLSLRYINSQLLPAMDDTIDLEYHTFPTKAVLAAYPPSTPSSFIVSLRDNHRQNPHL
jgi:hypothetical protein